MIVRLLEFCSEFDWITPTISLLRTKREDRFNMRIDQVAEINAISRITGIKTYRGTVTGGRYVFDVKKGDGEKFANALRRYGLLD